MDGAGMGFPIPTDSSMGGPPPGAAPGPAGPNAAPNGFPDLVRQIQELARAVATQYPAFSESADAIIKASLQGMMNVMQTQASGPPAMSAY